MFVLLTSISQYISTIVLFSEYEILTGRLVNTKLLGFRLLWDVTVYVIDRQNCPTPAQPGQSHSAAQADCSHKSAVSRPGSAAAQAVRLLFTVYCLPFTVYCLLFTVYHLLFTVNCRPSTTD
jgi:hypothetical protein